MKNIKVNITGEFPEAMVVFFAQSYGWSEGLNIPINEFINGLVSSHLKEHISAPFINKEREARNKKINEALKEKRAELEAVFLQEVEEIKKNADDFLEIDSSIIDAPDLPEEPVEEKEDPYIEGYIPNPVDDLPTPSKTKEEK